LLITQKITLHQDEKRFLDMLSQVIENKKAQITFGVHNNNLQENEKHVLALSIKSEQRGEGALTYKEL
jgi:hypothetical protein